MLVVPDLIDLSPNFNDAPVTGRTVVIHATRSDRDFNWPRELEATLNHMRTPGTVSSQWVIGRQRGQKVRVVPNHRQSWHAGVDNDNTWGIELVQSREADGFTQEQLDDLILVCQEYMALGVPPVRARTSGDPGFIGHQDTAQGKASGKSDPGNLFPWDWFIEALKGGVVPTFDKQKHQDALIRGSLQLNSGWAYGDLVSLVPVYEDFIKAIKENRQ